MIAKQHEAQAGRWRPIPPGTAPPPPTPQPTPPGTGGRPWEQPQPYRPTSNPHPPAATGGASVSARLATGDLVLGVDPDQPPATPLASAADRERDGEVALEEAAARLHRELAEADPTIRTAAEPEPLGRRLPVSLDASRQGVDQ